jgi:hypothetical protein
MTAASDRARERGQRVHEDVECPRCGAHVGERCHAVPGGWVIEHKHAARVQLSDQTHPAARRQWGEPEGQ